MKRAYFAFAVILLTLALFFTGCGQDAVQESEGPFATVVDQMGREVVVSSPPQRIVSLAPSNTEAAFALGLGDRVVGVTDYCNYPPEVEGKTKVGGFDNPNVEAIVALEPDLVLATSMHEGPVKKLESLGIPVLVLYPQSVDDVYQALELIGTLTGAIEEAEKVVAEMKSRIEKVQEKVGAIAEDEKVRVYYEVYSDPLMSVGKNGVIHEIITLAGGRNIFADVDEDYPKVSAEEVVKRNPQVILFPNYHGTEEFMVDSLKERPGWGEITALKENRVHAVEDDTFSRPGPRIAEAVEEAAHLFYPELFK